jgi:hypothetical protein
VLKTCNVRFEVFTAVTMKNGVFWDVNRVALVRTDVSEELSSSIFQGDKNRRTRKNVSRNKQQTQAANK